MKKWYLLKTKIKQEEVALNNLENQNYFVYCPRAIINNKNVALFPGYIFIHLDENYDNWSPIRSTKGVMNFVKFGLNFAKISDQVIDFIKQNEICTTEKIIELDSFKKGDIVQITDGIFKNCIAIFNSFKSEDRIFLLIDIMGQQQTINIQKKAVIGL